MGSTYLADILRIHASRLRNLYVMNVKISEIYKLTSKFHHKSLFYAVHSQNMFKNCWIFESRFFPDFPDPVFSGNFCLERLGDGQIKCHFVSYMNTFHILYEFIWWQKVADTKNAKNYFYLVSQFSKFL